MQDPLPKGPRAMPMAVDMAFPAPCLMSSLHIINQGAMPMLAARLQLTDEQKTSVGEMLKQADAALKPKIDLQRKAGEKYVDLLLKNDSSESALLAAAEEAMKTESVIVAEKIKTLQAVRALLNDQQKASLNSVLAQFSAPWRMKQMGPKPLPRPGEPTRPVSPETKP
jgi:Spy/CpxP family protein refolding chaperone